MTRPQYACRRAYVTCDRRRITSQSQQEGERVYEVIGANAPELRKAMTLGFKPPEEDAED